MAYPPRALGTLAEALERLPGIGAKSASRIAFHLLLADPEEAEALADAIRKARASVRRCPICNALTDGDLCEFCSDPSRDGLVICVVAEAADVGVIERTREYRGRYHVLNGLLSPLRGIGPDEIDASGVLRRIDGTVKEVILATGPTVEGEATALYLARLLKPRNLSVSRIAFGLPVGGDLEYADEVTMARSLANRREI